MARRIPTACRKPGCPELTRDDYCHRHQGYQKAVKADYEKRYDAKRDSRYKLNRWRKARNSYAARHPLCEECLEKGQTVSMKVVDHKVEVKDGGDFFSTENFKSLCAEHHNRKTADAKKVRAQASV